MKEEYSVTAEFLGRRYEKTVRAAEEYRRNKTDLIGSGTSTVTTTNAKPGEYFIQVICRWCNGIYLDDRCPCVKKIKYFKDGSVKRVEFHKERKEARATIRDTPYQYPTITNWTADSSFDIAKS